MLQKEKGIRNATPPQSSELNKEAARAIMGVLNDTMGYLKKKGIPIKRVVKELKFIPFLVNKLLEMNEIETSSNEKLLEEFFQGAASAYIYASLYEPHLGDDSTEEFSKLKISAERAIMTLLNNTLYSSEVTKLDDSEDPNLCLDNDLQGIRTVEIEKDSVKIHIVGEDKENIENVANMKVKIEKELTLSQLHEDCFLPETFEAEKLCGRVLQNSQGSKVEEGPSEISTRKREISTDEQTEILEGSQTSMDNETLIKRLGRISNKMLPLKVQEIQPKVSTPTKDVIARIQKMMKNPIATESLQSSIENLVDNMPLGNL
ncbi:uncharacterized protein LOC113314114 isoform X2 [Papaver somniferum]|uniref:uncharacterized protein LOC113314114 isoform X2 n=1 Tax=Papaver somniferum TaxID=3469 RepID=UPI000E6FA5F2|nr:uncharacterized protein LOC113314114 isoform X2 [Papaver somniferum]